MSMPAADQAGFNQDSLIAADNFRLLLDAMARPGAVFELPVPQHGTRVLNAGAATALLTLCDHETPVWLEENLEDESVIDFLRFNCGCPLVDDVKLAMFAVLPLHFAAYAQNEFALGMPAYPDRSTTLIIQVETLGDNGSIVLSGPGIKSTQRFHVEGLSEEFWSWRAEKNKNFPLGIDVILATDDKLAALPRTTKVREIA